MNISRLTDRGLLALKPKSKRYRVYIDSSPGLFLLVGTGGRIAFQFRYQIEGQRREINIGSYPAKSLKELLLEYQELSVKFENGIDPLHERQKEEVEAQVQEAEQSFKSLGDRYLTYYATPQLKPRTVVEYKRLIDKFILPAWGSFTIDEIDKMTIIRLVENISLKTPIQANRVLATIKGILTYAVSVGLLESSPAASIRPPGKEVVKERVLSATELEELFFILNDPDKCPRNFADALRLILLTGQRPGEIVAMRLSQIRDGWFEMEGKDIKPGKGHRVFLSVPARQIIEDRKEDFALEEYVFPVEGKTPHMRRDTLTSRVRKMQQHLQNVGAFTPHDLRRTAATHIAMLKHGSVVPDILGHSVTGVTRTFYDKYDRAEEIEQALIAWANELHRIESDRKDNVIEANFK